MSVTPQHTKTRKELAAEAVLLGRELGLEVSTDRLNHAALTELVAKLRADLDAKGVAVADAAGAPSESPPAGTTPEGTTEPSPAEGPTATVPTEPTPPPAPAPAVAPPMPRAPYLVAPKRSTIVRGRVVGSGTPVSAGDFERGQEDLDYLVARGVVIRT